MSQARVEVEEYRWERISVAGTGHPHAFARAGQDIRTTAVTAAGKGSAQQRWVISGLKDLILLKSTGSEFAGFLTDRYTTLPETHDRVLATSLTARWRYQATASGGRQTGEPLGEPLGAARGEPVSAARGGALGRGARTDPADPA